MIILDEKDLETVVGGQSLAEYAIISAALPQVAANNPNAVPGGGNDKAFDALYHASLEKLVHTL